MKKRFTITSTTILIALVILLVGSLLFVIYYTALVPKQKVSFNPGNAALKPPVPSTAIYLSNKTVNALGVGSVAPDFVLEKADGEKAKLSNFRNRAVLLSFIYVHNSSEADKAQATRAQLTFLKSMHKQYGGNGLTIILVDESHRVNNTKTSDETFTNFIYDQELQGMHLLKDNANLAGKYGVTVLPTTFLIAKDGRITQKWQDVALSSQLALAIYEELGVSYLREIEFDVSEASIMKDTWPTEAQTIFPGFGAARPLSDKIWLVDGGVTWKKNNPFPLNIFVLTGSGVRIQLKAINAENNHSVIILDELMELLPADESKIAVRNMPGVDSPVYTTTAPVLIKNSGKYTLQATVSKAETGEKLLEGAARIIVE